MTREEFNTIVARRQELINNVLASKGTEYSAGNQDAFHNFKKAIGLSFHNTQEKVAWEFAVKHFQSIKDMLDHLSIDGFNGHPKTEYVEEKIGDAINYLILIEGMIKERIKNYNKL